MAEQLRKINQKLVVNQRQVRRLNFLTWGALVSALVLLTGGWFVYQQQQDIQDSRIQQCENANATRVGQQAAWRELLNVSTASLEAQSAAEGVKPPKAVLAYYQAYTDWIEDDLFPLRDCENLDKAYPEPGPPPSFEKALKASLRQQQRDDGGQ